MPLSRYTLKRAIGEGESARRVLEIQREANLGDFIECERKGWMVNGDVRDDCELQFTGYMLWQLCGVLPVDALLLHKDDLPGVAAWLRPFVQSGSPETGAQ